MIPLPYRRTYGLAEKKRKKMHIRQSCQRHEIPVTPDKADRPQSEGRDCVLCSVLKARHLSSRRKYRSSSTIPFYSRKTCTLQRRTRYDSVLKKVAYLWHAGY